MTELPFLNLIFVLLIDLLSVWLGFWVFFSDRKNKINQLFLLITISTIAWVTFGYLSYESDQISWALLWKRLFYGGVSSFLIITYFFSVFFPKEGKRHSILDKIVLITELAFLFLSIFTNLIVKDVKVKEWGNDVIFGKGGATFFIIMILLTLVIVGQLLKKYFGLPKEEKLKVQYLLIGTFIFAAINLIFNMIFPFLLNTYQYHYFGDYSTIIFLGFTAYAIVKRELFGIRVVITTIFVSLIAILLGLDALIFTEQVYMQLFKGLILVIFLYFGYLLIKSVVREIAQRQEIERLSNAKTEFISIASHQLRTPLTAIKGYISMIMEGTYGKMPKKTKKPIENVYESNEKLVKLVNDLLDFSRLESGKIEITKKKTSIGDLISKVVEIFQVEAKNSGLYLKFEKKSVPEVMIDPGKIEDAISNLIKNAIKYTPKGGITIKLKNVNGKIQIEVSDTGVGMTKEEISMLFQSFVRGAVGSKLYSQGAGLGLYIAKKYVEMHGGTLTVVSPGQGKGTTFTIELPIK